MGGTNDDGSRKEEKQQEPSPNNPKICIINTDNVSHNGDAIRRYMMELANEKNDRDDIQRFLKESVVFHNTMVDRITSERPTKTKQPSSSSSSKGGGLTVP